LDSNKNKTQSETQVTNYKSNDIDLFNKDNKIKLKKHKQSDISESVNVLKDIKFDKIKVLTAD